MFVDHISCATCHHRKGDVCLKFTERNFKYIDKYFNDFMDMKDDDVKKHIQELSKVRIDDTTSFRCSDYQ
ncbi:MAG: hypothetical protein RR440_01665 [Erysipelotrichaceae bacterium]